MYSWRCFQKSGPHFHYADNPAAEARQCFKTAVFTNGCLARSSVGRILAEAPTLSNDVELGCITMSTWIKSPPDCHVLQWNQKGAPSLCHRIGIVLQWHRNIRGCSNISEIFTQPFISFWNFTQLASHSTIGIILFYRILHPKDSVHLMYDPRSEKNSLGKALCILEYILTHSWYRKTCNLRHISGSRKATGLSISFLAVSETTSICIYLSLRKKDKGWEVTPWSTCHMSVRTWTCSLPCPMPTQEAGYRQPQVPTILSLRRWRREIRLNKWISELIRS